jgi:CRP/FNR family transcriptional regulator
MITAPAGHLDFLSRITEDDRGDLLQLACPTRVPRNGYVFRRGDPGSHAYILREGIVKVFDVSDGGRDTILWFCLAGEVFGLAEAVAGGIHGVSARACERCDVLSIRSDLFRAYLGKHPKASLLCMQALSSRLRGLGDVLVNFVSDDVHTRVGKLLLRLAARYGDSRDGEIVLHMPLTHQTVADMVGASRPTVTQVLGELKRRGVLRVEGQRIRVESAELLRELTGV